MCSPKASCCDTLHLFILKIVLYYTADILDTEVFSPYIQYVFMHVSICISKANLKFQKALSEEQCVHKRSVLEIYTFILTFKKCDPDSFAKKPESRNQNLKYQNAQHLIL